MDEHAGRRRVLAWCVMGVNRARSRGRHSSRQPVTPQIRYLAHHSFSKLVDRSLRVTVDCKLSPCSAPFTLNFLSSRFHRSSVKTNCIAGASFLGRRLQLQHKHLDHAVQRTLVVVRTLLEEQAVYTSLYCICGAAFSGDRAACQRAYGGPCPREAVIPMRRPITPFAAAGLQLLHLQRATKPCSSSPDSPQSRILHHRSLPHLHKPLSAAPDPSSP
jgi:hypothetical protein